MVYLDIPTSEIPGSLADSIRREVGPYSIALGCYLDSKNEGFRAIGSGTLVQRGEKKGILTAFHCLSNSQSRDISLGKDGTDSIVVMGHRNNTRVIPPQNMKVHALAKPQVEGEGPDLCFIEILPSPSLKSVEMFASFWRIDERRLETAEQFVHDKICTALIGYPSEDHKTSVYGDIVEHQHSSMIFWGAMGLEDIIRINGWDYVDSICDRTHSPSLPSSYAGVSGGGIWAIRLSRNSAHEFLVDEICLIGVAFSQTPPDEGKRTIRGHYIDSIYNHAWSQQKS